MIQGCPVISLNDTDSCKAFWEFKLALGNSQFRDDFPTIPRPKWAFRLPARFSLIAKGLFLLSDSVLGCVSKAWYPPVPVPKMIQKQIRTGLPCPFRYTQQKDGSREDEETTSGSLNPTNPSPQPVPKHYKHTQ